MRRVDGRRGFHARLSPGEVLPGLQDWLHLRGHLQHPAQHHRQVPQARVLVNNVTKHKTGALFTPKEIYIKRKKPYLHE